MVAMSSCRIIYLLLLHRLCNLHVSASAYNDWNAIYLASASNIVIISIAFLVNLPSLQISTHYLKISM